jgi:hypothetical protein
LIKADQTGWLFDPDDAASYAGVMIEAMMEADRSIRMASLLQANIRRQMTWVQCAQHYERIFTSEDDAASA